MGLFDMFDGKKSRLAEAGDQLLENAARTTGEIFEKPVREKAMKTINGAEDLIT